MRAHVPALLRPQFITSTQSLQHEGGTIVSPNRAKVNVEIQNFPFSLHVRPRLAIKVAHAAAAPTVSMGVIGTIGTFPSFDLSSFDLSMLKDALGSFPRLPAFPFPSLPSSPALPGLPGWLPWAKASAAGSLDVASAATDTIGEAVSRLVMSQVNGIEVNRWGRADATAVYTAAAARAAAASPGLAQLAWQQFGGDMVTQLLSNGSLAPLPASVFASAAYSTWDQHVFVDKNGTRARATASALGTAGYDVSGIAGIGASFLAGVNATASKQVVSFDTNSAYILWDPAIGLGERVEWRAARADAAAAAAIAEREQEPAAPEAAPATDGGDAVPNGVNQAEVTSAARVLPQWVRTWLWLPLCTLALLAGVALNVRRRRRARLALVVGKAGGKAVPPTTPTESIAPVLVLPPAPDEPAAMSGHLQTATASPRLVHEAAASGGTESESRV